MEGTTHFLVATSMGCGLVIIIDMHQMFVLKGVVRLCLQVC